ncbi:D-alanyl-D-alanine carboxypeptidase/D-alanyl-D-alanine-endopeptidase [Saccharopolyspora gloriosae]|uniref:D-alanyl-D-alanine carboxypeptidase/D-alanyl-D-alanine endopeptidase n=1 Tax=Saccharopolyspora gloriosae TaxID=455344 RepID=UPI001FB603DE|nr:D-alanyl-D-alanine carboxypeptidase/D-alanyl-D-alanine-endopeptidase [Saccharopolyspora gloriosae]
MPEPHSLRGEVSEPDATEQSASATAASTAGSQGDDQGRDADAEHPERDGARAEAQPWPTELEAAESAGDDPGFPVEDQEKPAASDSESAADSSAGEERNESASSGDEQPVNTDAGEVTSADGTGAAQAASTRGSLTGTVRIDQDEKSASGAPDDSAEQDSGPAESGTTGSGVDDSSAGDSASGESGADDARADEPTSDSDAGGSGAGDSGTGDSAADETGSSGSASGDVQGSDQSRADDASTGDDERTGQRGSVTGTVSGKLSEPEAAGEQSTSTAGPEQASEDTAADAGPSAGSTVRGSLENTATGDGATGDGATGDGASGDGASEGTSGSAGAAAPTVRAVGFVGSVEPAGREAAAHDFSGWRAAGSQVTGMISGVEPAASAVPDTGGKGTGAASETGSADSDSADESEVSESGSSTSEQSGSESAGSESAAAEESESDSAESTTADSVTGRVETVGTDSETTESKAGESKAVESKAVESKAVESKAGDAGTSDAGVPDSTSSAAEQVGSEPAASEKPASERTADTDTEQAGSPTPGDQPAEADAEPSATEASGSGADAEPEGTVDGAAAPDDGARENAATTTGQDESGQAHDGESPIEQGDQDESPRSGAIEWAEQGDQGESPRQDAADQDDQDEPSRSDAIEWAEQGESSRQGAVEEGDQDESSRSGAIEWAEQGESSRQGAAEQGDQDESSRQDADEQGDQDESSRPDAAEQSGSATTPEAVEKEPEQDSARPETSDRAGSVGAGAWPETASAAEDTAADETATPEPVEDAETTGPQQPVRDADPAEPASGVSAEADTSAAPQVEPVEDVEVTGPQRAVSADAAPSTDADSRSEPADESESVAERSGPPTERLDRRALADYAAAADRRAESDRQETTPTSDRDETGGAAAERPTAETGGPATAATAPDAATADAVSTDESPADEATADAVDTGDTETTSGASADVRTARDSTAEADRDATADVDGGRDTVADTGTSRDAEADRDATADVETTGRFSAIDDTTARVDRRHVDQRLDDQRLDDQRLDDQRPESDREDAQRPDETQAAASGTAAKPERDEWPTAEQARIEAEPEDTDAAEADSAFSADAGAAPPSSTDPRPRTEPPPSVEDSAFTADSGTPIGPSPVEQTQQFRRIEDTQRFNLADLEKETRRREQADQPKGSQPAYESPQAFREGDGPADPRTDGKRPAEHDGAPGGGQTQRPQSFDQGPPTTRIPIVPPAPPQPARPPVPGPSDAERTQQFRRPDFSGPPPGARQGQSQAQPAPPRPTPAPPRQPQQSPQQQNQAQQSPAQQNEQQSQARSAQPQDFAAPAGAFQQPPLQDAHRATPQRIEPQDEPEHVEHDEPQQVAEPRRKRATVLLAVLTVVVLGAGLAVGVPALITGLSAARLADAPAPVRLSPSIRPVGANAPEPGKAGLEAAVRGPLSNPVLAPVTGAVVDVQSGRSLWEREQNRPMMPASTGKLLTMSAAMLALDHDARFTTKVVRGSEPGSVVLVGGGDPTLSTLPAGEDSVYPGAARFDDLAAQVRAATGGQVTSIKVDTSRYKGDSSAPGWLPQDIPDGIMAPMESVMADGGRTDDPTDDYGARTTSPAAKAGEELATRLGLSASAVSEGTAPQNAQAVGSVESPTMRKLMETTLIHSDNVLAEALAREVAVKTGNEPSFAGSVKAVREVLQRNGVDLTGVQMSDGSGLSTEDRIPAKVLADLMATATAPERDGGLSQQSSKLRALLTGLPVAGGSGSLADRYGDGDGRGWVRAKTGTLDGANSLSGTILTQDGRLLVFALMSNSTAAAGSVRPALDEVAGAIQQCGCG